MTIYSVCYKLYSILPMKVFKKQILEAYRLLCLRSVRKGSLVVKRGGIVYELDLAQSIDNSIYHLGCYEPYVTKAIRRMCKRGMTVIDIGANIGAHTFRLAKLVGPAGRVIAFEPTSWAFKKLEKNLALNDFRNVELVKMALSNTSEHQNNVGFSSSWPIEYNEEDAKCHPIHHGYGVEETVRLSTLDQEMKERGPKKVDLLKIDVDGYELKVCQGGTQTLRAHMPLIIIEIGRPTMEEVGDSPEELIKMLFELGYGFYSVRDLNRFDDVSAVAHSIEQKRVENFILSASALK
jgi:FkbM family methyltransferase